MTSGLLAWAIFLALSAVAIGAAAALVLTMSMVRAGLALMASFVALAGLFVLLDADLLAAVQVMMNVGGMLVMIVVMVMAMMDPGGSRMWAMKRDMAMKGPGALAMHMPRGEPPSDPKTKEHHRMMTDMAMTTTLLPWALAVGAFAAAALVLLVTTTPWPETSRPPTRDATDAVGELLLGRYMIGFEGAAFLILAGIVAAVVLGRREPEDARANDEG